MTAVLVLLSAVVAIGATGWLLWSSRQATAPAPAAQRRSVTFRLVDGDWVAGPVTVLTDKAAGRNANGPDAHHLREGETS